MSGMETASLQLPKDLIEAAINQHVGLAIAKALGGHEMLIQRTVQEILTESVDSDGKRSTYSSDRNRTFVDWAMRKSLQVAVQKAINEEIAKYEPTIRKQIATQLAATKSPLVKQLVDSMVSGMIKAASDQWRLTVEIKDRQS